MYIEKKNLPLIIKENIMDNVNINLWAPQDVENISHRNIWVVKLLQ